MSRASFSALDAQAMTSAPSSFARITQPVPTPPEAPSTSTRSPALTVVVGDQHAVRGAVGDRQRGGVLEAHGGRHGDELVGGDQAIFRHAAVEHFAHQAFLLVDRIDQHAVAGLPAGHAGADLGDLARHVEADDDRQRHLDARHAAHGEHVVVIERGRAHADDDVAVDRPCGVG